MKQRPLRLNMKQLRHFLVFSGLFFALLLVFQNCAQPLSQEDELASVAATAPFAFDTKVDTIAHLSCNYSNNVDPGAYYSFKAGAYRALSGLKFTDSFISATGGYAPEKRAQVLAHPQGQNADIAFVMGILYRSDLHMYSNILGAFDPPLSSPLVASSLPQVVGNATRVNFFAGKNLSSSFIVPPANVPQFRTMSQMGLTYSGPANTDQRLILAQYYSKDGDSVAVGDGTPRGTAYYLDFMAPSHIGTVSSGFPENKNILSGVTEKTLSGREGPISGLWSCENYLIVRNNEQNFTQNADSIGPDLNRYNELRQLLPASGWFINLDPVNASLGYKGYIIPKVASCYGNNINYGSGNQGTPPNYPGIPGFVGDCSNASNTCPHYFSVCKRN